MHGKTGKVQSAEKFTNVNCKNSIMLTMDNGDRVHEDDVIFEGVNGRPA